MPKGFWAPGAPGFINSGRGKAPVDAICKSNSVNRFSVTRDKGLKSKVAASVARVAEGAVSVHAYDDDWASGRSHIRRNLLSFLNRLGMVLAAVILLAFGILILAAANTPDTSRRAASAISAPAPAWVDIVRPIHIFDLNAPELAKSPLHYAARRAADGGGRQDILTFGTPTDSPYLRLSLYRVGSEAAPDAPLYVDLVRNAAEADLAILRSRVPEQLATRFGPLEVSDITLAAQSGATSPCLGFRGAALAGKFRILGFACGGVELLSRPALACLIERLDLEEAGDDHDLASFFAASELKRDPACFGNALRPTGTRASWLDRNDARPPLEGKKLL